MDRQNSIYHFRMYFTMTLKQPYAKVYISMLWRDKRKGKGFSRGELARAGITLENAMIHSIPLDKRRRTTHSWNVHALIAWITVIPLVNVKGIGKVTAAKLKAVGINNARDLANCDLKELVTKGFSETTLSRWKQNAQHLLESS